MRVGEISRRRNERPTAMPQLQLRPVLNPPISQQPPCMSVREQRHVTSVSNLLSDSHWRLVNFHRRFFHGTQSPLRADASLCDDCCDKLLAPHCSVTPWSCAVPSSEDDSPSVTFTSGLRNLTTQRRQTPQQHVTTNCYGPAGSRRLGPVFRLPRKIALPVTL